VSRLDVKRVRQVLVEGSGLLLALAVKGTVVSRGAFGPDRVGIAARAASAPEGEIAEAD